MGIALPFQVIISSSAHEQSTPISLTHITLKFEGGLRDIRIMHDEKAEYRASTPDKRHQLYEASLQKAANDALIAKGELSFSPGVAKTFLLAALPLDAGDTKLSSITLYCTTERFDLAFTISNDEQLGQSHIWVASGTGLSRMPLHSERNLSVVVLPKPPNMRIQIPDLAKAYFTDEHIALNVHVINDEEEDSNVDLDVRLLGQEEEMPVGLRWASVAAKGEEIEEQTQEEGDQHGPTTDRTLSTALGQMNPLETRKHTILFQAKPETAQCSLEVKARYHLLSEPKTPISKVLTLDMHFMRPFEAKFEFRPQVSQELWPNYFRMPDHSDISGVALDEETQAEGLSQKWSMAAAIASFATHALVVEAVELKVLAIHEKAVCQISHDPPTAPEPISLLPSDIHSRTFTLDLQKLSLDDRLTTYFNLQLLLTWRRDIPGSPSARTLLPAPELVIPFGEPRVLASAQLSKSEPYFINLDYTIENPSMYVLSFSVTMDASEEFAFSGPKATAVQLVPLSRHVVRYKLLPLVRGKWISPQVKVVDVHWNKILKAVGTGDMKSDRRGVLVWVDAEE